MWATKFHRAAVWSYVLRVKASTFTPST
jgi:hypothetical protein